MVYRPYFDFDDLEHHFTVITPRCDHADDYYKIRDFINAHCVRGDWGCDFLHTPENDWKLKRYLFYFSDKQDAAIFKVAFG